MRSTGRGVEGARRHCCGGAPWRKTTTLRYSSSCSLCPMGRWSPQPGLSSSDASTRDRPGLAAQARNETRPGAGSCVDEVVPNARLRRGASRAGTPPRQHRSNCQSTANPGRCNQQHDGARPATPSAASDEAERYPRPKRRRRARTDPLLGEGCAACGSTVVNRSCAPSGADPYPASFVPHEDGSAQGYGRIRNDETAVRPEGVTTRRNGQTRTPAARKGEGYESRGYGPFPLMFQASAHAPVVEQRGRRQGSERA